MDLIQNVILYKLLLKFIQIAAKVMYKIALEVLCSLLFYVNSGISGIPES